MQARAKRERGSAKPQEVGRSYREKDAAFAAGDRLKPVPDGICVSVFTVRNSYEFKKLRLDLPKDVQRFAIEDAVAGNPTR